MEIIKMAKTKKAPVAEEVVEAAPQAEHPTLTIADLQLIAQVIDLASSRGAFRAGEFEQVGAVYTKLTGFLSHIASATAEPAAEETAGEASE